MNLRSSPIPQFRFEILSSDFPHLFQRIPGPPRSLFVQARSVAALQLLHDLPDRGLAIVGTRRPQQRSFELMKNTVTPMKAGSWVILSGLALGIDTYAHQLALELGIPTIAILGGPLSSVYPPENEALAQKILGSGGLLISEFSPEDGIRKHHFLKRNRILAAWSRAVWVVEAGRSSGALNTAKWARDHGQDCYATPSFPGDLAFVGTMGLLERGLAWPLYGYASFLQSWPDLPWKVEDA